MCNYIVTEEEIEKAEKDIFKKGEHFNNEQKSFLRCLDPCFVQAYAGTGKTSTIVGKLHVLAQKNIWQNGRGICVISHTNVAVNEIKKHVAKHYPAIMEYPNFVGTIQEFTNKFLFIPYLSSKGLKIKFQEENRWLNFNGFPIVKDRIDKYRNSINRKSNNNNEQQLERFNKAIYSCFLNDSEISILTNKGKIVSLLSCFNKLPTKVCDKITIINALKMCISERKMAGSFLFCESFINGLEYVKQNNILKNIISQRFQFAFLDEAQDCSEIQLNSLKELFNNNSKTIFQQIGDTNQAITETEWTYINPLYLGKSERFKENLASFVNKFKIDNGSGVIGKSINNSSQKVKLFLIKYNIGKESDVLKKFAEILKTKNISTDKDFFAISHKHEQLLKYFTEYNEKIAKNQNQKKSVRFKYDIEYLNLLTKESIRKQGSNFVSKILFGLLYKHFKVDRDSLGNLREYLQTNEKLDSFKKTVLGVNKEILINGKLSDLSGLENKLNVLINSNKINFTSNNTTNNFVALHKNNTMNVFINDGIKINVGTIHSVKGQTHNATLCFSNKEFDKYDIDHALLDNNNSRTLFYKKLLYVAASRPKYLFALAIENGAFNALKDKTIFQDFNQVLVG